KPNLSTILVNEDYLDLRKYPENSLSSKKSNTGLINCGLKKLVTSYNATANTYPQKQVLNKKKCRTKEKSMFDPRFRSKKTTNIEVESTKNKFEPHKNKCTMTKNEKHEGRIIKPRKNHNTDHSHKYTRMKDCQENQQYLDPRLCEKYSVLKMPWKRTWTIPVFSPKSSTLMTNRGFDNFDRQTYLYDDGTEIDSVYIEGKKKQIFSKAFQNQCMALLFLGGSLCGIILVSLLIWFIFGNDFFHMFFKTREPHEGFVKHSVKYIGGGIIYLITTFFKTLGKVLAIPVSTII
ncbi:hypothetical protein NQ314_012875, partial [Rhamnusium bicolor]